MNFNNFTIKSQEAVQEAVNLVQSRGQQAIEPEHLMTGPANRYGARQADSLVAEGIGRGTLPEP